MAITLTEKAAAKIKEIIKDDDLGTKEKTHLRIRVLGGGCSGFKFDLTLDTNKINEEDDVIFYSNNIRIAVNNLCLVYCDGTEIDYIDKLYGGGFKFNNPEKFNKFCGCGSSFSMKE
jgi:iron-sulfur cluster insertion protein